MPGTCNSPVIKVLVRFCGIYLYKEVLEGVGWMGLEALLTYEKTAADSVDLFFKVMNSSDAPEKVTFRSGQRYDYILYRDGQRVEQFSEDKMFIMIYEELLVGAGDSLDFQIPLTKLEPGSYKIVVWLADRDWPTVRERLEFTV